MKTKYIVRATHYFYAGTLYAPKDGAISDESGTRREFETKDAAQAFCVDVLELESNPDGTFSRPGVYLTQSGEYARPVYSIRKLPV